MKNALFIIIFLLSFDGKAQSVSYIKYEYTEILAFSIEISYSSSNGAYQHYSPYSSYGNVLATLQARYDYYHSVISKEYYKLKELELINKSNQATLNTYRNQRLNWVYQAGSTWDLGNASNSTQIINYCTEIYSYPSIKKEITLMQKCQNEISRLKYADPNGYPLSKRYASISKVLEQLATCSPDDIGKLNWESIEIEDNAKKSQSNYSNNSTSDAYVNSATLNVRSGASTGSGIITSLSKGDKLEIVEVVNEKWTKVKVKYWDSYSNSYNTSYGYVYSSFISTSNPNREQESLSELFKTLSSPYGENMGKVAFWTSCGNDGDILIYLDGQYVGTLTSFYESSPDCKSSGTVSIIKPVGTYKFKGQGTNFSWNGEITITDGQCKLQQLSK